MATRSTDERPAWRRAMPAVASGVVVLAVALGIVIAVGHNDSTQFISAASTQSSESPSPSSSLFALVWPLSDAQIQRVSVDTWTAYGDASPTSASYVTTTYGAAIQLLTDEGGFSPGSVQEKSPPSDDMAIVLVQASGTFHDRFSAPGKQSNTGGYVVEAMNADDPVAKFAYGPMSSPLDLSRLGEVQGLNL